MGRKIKEELLEVLQDREVINTLKVLLERSCKEDEEEIVKLKKEIQNERKNVGMLVEKYGNLEAEILQLREEKAKEISQIKQEKESEILQLKENYKEELVKKENDYNLLQQKYQRACAEVSEYQKTYGSMRELYDKYVRLGDEIHRACERVLSAASLESFLSWGMQWRNIEALYDVIKNALSVGRYDVKDINILIEIFDYFFEHYYKNEGENPEYVRDTVSVGERMDDFKHSRYNDDCVTGMIEEIILRGYGKIDGTETYKVEEKSIVRIRN